MFVDTAELGLMAQAEHDGCTGVEWDPTGRYVITAASSLHQKVARYACMTLTHFHSVFPG